MRIISNILLVLLFFRCSVKETIPKPEIIYQETFKITPPNHDQVKGIHMNVYSESTDKSKKKYLIEWADEQVKDYDFFLVIFFNDKKKIPIIEVPTVISYKSESDFFADYSTDENGKRIFNYNILFYKK